MFPSPIIAWRSARSYEWTWVARVRTVWTAGDQFGDAWRRGAVRSRGRSRGYGQLSASKGICTNMDTGPAETPAHNFRPQTVTPLGSNSFCNNLVAFCGSHFTQESLIPAVKRARTWSVNYGRNKHIGNKRQNRRCLVHISSDLSGRATQKMIQLRNIKKVYFFT